MRTFKSMDSGVRLCRFVIYISIYFKVISTPKVGVELTTPKSRVACSSGASQVPQIV